MPLTDVEKAGKTPFISVIVCTYNRSNLLQKNLSSLLSQTLDKNLFEVVVVDDGSTDQTPQVVQSFLQRLPLRYFYQHNAGLSSARNHGLFVSRGKIVLFFDDDDTATPSFLENHIKMHHQYPTENFAVLNHTDWHPDLAVTPLMHYVTQVGCFLFSYPNIKHLDILDYTFFWGGRISCKRSLLLKHGIFRPDIKIHYEDIELGYRLSQKAELKIVYSADTVSHMARSVSFDDFCQRMMAQGRSAYRLAQLHSSPEMIEYCETEGAVLRWEKIAPIFYPRVRAAREIDAFATLKWRYFSELDDQIQPLLHASYGWIFRACKLKGMVETSKMNTQMG